MRKVMAQGSAGDASLGRSAAWLALLLVVSAGVGTLAVRAHPPAVADRSAETQPSAALPPQPSPAQPVETAATAPVLENSLDRPPEVFSPPKPLVEKYSPTRPLVAGSRGAYVRPTPATDLQPLVELSPGTPVSINGRIRIGDRYWYRVALADGRTGFVRNDAVRESEPAAVPATRDLSASASPAPIASDRSGLIRGELVEWRRRATAQQLAAVYPPRALKKRQGGTVGLKCVVQSRGDLGTCTVENPGRTDKDFAAAALKVAKRFRMDPVLKDGSSAVGRPYRLEIEFKPPKR
jgi:TonB family protein